MTKCDLCSSSHLENGKLVCPFIVCVLSQNKILELFREANEKRKEENYGK